MFIKQTCGYVSKQVIHTHWSRCT